MTGLTSLLDNLDDRLNPIVVKELRQAIQGRFIPAMLILFLTIQLGVLGWILVQQGITGSLQTSRSFHAGRDVFKILFGIQLGICMLLVPTYTAVRLSLERSSANVDLLFITTLTPGAIIRGKLAASMIFAMLIHSAFVPFLFFAYLLRGIDLLSMLGALALGLPLVALSVQLGIFIGCIPASKFFKSLLSGVGATALVVLFVAATGAVRYVLDRGLYEIILAKRPGPELALAVVFAFLLGLLYLLSVALIKPASANRALPIRLYITLAWIAAFITAWLSAIRERDWDAILVWMAISTVAYSCLMLAAFSERVRWRPRVARTIPKRVWLRIPAFLFYSGCAGGVALSVTAIALSTGFPHLVGRLQTTSAGWSSHREVPEAVQVFAGLGLYLFSYAMTAWLLRRRFLSSSVPAEHTWVLALLMLAIGSVAPVLVGLLLKSDPILSGGDGFSFWHLGNPFMLQRDYLRPAYLIFASAWAGIVGLLGLPGMIRQAREFRPYRPAAETPGEPQRMRSR